MNNRGNSLVGMLITLAIIAILAVVLMKGSGVFSAPGTGSPRADGRGTTVPGLVKANAEDQVCRSNLGQIRQAIQVQSLGSGDDDRPASIDAINIGSSFKKCPMGGEPYQYNPTTGEVHCTHPGHEKF